MKSPFPGMDPFLEGYLWPDVHHSLAFTIKKLLVPQISPKYVARIDTYTVADTEPQEDIGIMYPDVEILKRKDILKEATPAYGKQPPITPASITIPATSIIEIRIPVVEIRDLKNNRLITAIEILSPVNKRKPGLPAYREKRRRLLRSGVHLLEIDLLRRGTRPFAHPYMPTAHYIMTLVRAGSGQTDVWTVDIKDSLPVLPVPLITPDEDVHLDLGKALATVYEESQYQLSINYQETPPPPPFDDASRQWMKELIEAG